MAWVALGLKLSSDQLVVTMMLREHRVGNYEIVSIT